MTQALNLENEQRRQKWKELWLPALLCLVLLAVEVTLLIFPDANEGQGQEGLVIGSVNRAKQDVRLRMADSLAWLEATDGADLRHLDSIATLEHSTATLEFVDTGMKLELAPQTLVVIENLVTEAGGRRRLKLRLNHGEIRARVEPRKVKNSQPTLLEVALPNAMPNTGDKKNVVQIEGLAERTSVVRVSSDDTTGASTLAVEEGALMVDGQKRSAEIPVPITTPAAQPVALPESSPTPAKVLPKKLPKPKIRPPKFKEKESKLENIFTKISQLVMPQAHAQDSQAFMELTWDKIEGARAYRLQIGATGDFKKPLFQAEVQDSRFDLTLDQIGNLQTIYYRVAAIDEHGVPGEFSDTSPIQRDQFQPFPSPSPKKISVHLAAGPFYHFRKFLNPSAPSTIYGRGIVPTGFSVEGHYAAKKDWFVSAGSRFFLEYMKPTDFHVQSGYYGVSHVQFWATVQKRRDSIDVGAGIYAANSFNISWNEITPSISPITMVGLALIAMPTLRARHGFNWRVLLGVPLLNAQGIDLDIRLRFPIGKATQLVFENQTWFVEGFGLGRWIASEELSAAFGIQVGHGF